MRIELDGLRSGMWNDVTFFVPRHFGKFPRLFGRGDFADVQSDLVAE